MTTVFEELLCFSNQVLTMISMLLIKWKLILVDIKQVKSDSYLKLTTYKK